MVLLVISTSVFFLSFFVQSHTKSERVVQKKQSYHGIVIAAVFLMATFSQGAVNSFLASYAKVLHFGNIGLFFTITAVVTFISMFFSQKIQNYLGLRKAACILSAVMGICILLISFVTSEFQLVLLAVPYGLSTGLLFPIFNYRIIQTVDASQFAFATSIYYCALDIGYGIGAVVWGYISQYAGYHIVFIIAAVLVFAMVLVDQIVYRTEKTQVCEAESLA